MLITRQDLFTTGLVALGMAVQPGVLAQPAMNVTGNVTTDVAPSTPGAREAVRLDQALLEQVAAAMAADPVLAGAQIDIQIDNGRVVLHGVARDTAQVNHAVSVAQGVAGSANVTSWLTTSG